MYSLGDDFRTLSVFIAIPGSTVVSCSCVSRLVLDIFSTAPVSGRILFDAGLPEEHACLRFLLQQWIHVTVSSRRRGCCLRFQRNACSSVIHAMRQSRSFLLVAIRDARHHGRYGSEEQLHRHWWHAWLVFLVTLHLALCFLPCCQAQDACRRSRWQVRIMADMYQKEGYVVQLIKVVFIPVVMQRRIPWSHTP